MTARSIRRAQERKAKKLARKAEKTRVGQAVNLQADCQPDCQSALAFEPDFNTEDSNLSDRISEARLAANRANGQLSTGPKSDNGKVKSSLNAVKTGLTGATVLLPSDDVAAYERHIASSLADWKPATNREKVLVQSIADTEWRLLRIPSLESGIYALGHLEFANSLDDQDPALRPGLIEVKTFLKYERQLRNLQLQESRLQRRREKEIAELRTLQLERQRNEFEDLEKVGQALSPGMSDMSRPDQNGFVFSTGKVNQSLSPALPVTSIAAPRVPPESCAA